MRAVLWAAVVFLPVLSWARGNYADTDNRDLHKLLVEDQRAELAVHEAEARVRIARRKDMQSAVGAVSEATLHALEHEIELDAHQTAALAAKVRATEVKLLAYDAFIHGKKKDWLRADVESNAAAVAMLEAEERKAALDVAYLKRRHARLESTFQAGALPWATVRFATLELEKAELRRAANGRKLVEQRRQLAEAEAELKKHGSPR